MFLGFRSKARYKTVEEFLAIGILQFQALCDIKCMVLTTANTGLFISPSGTSELDCATTKKDRAERSTTIGRETLKVLFCTRGLGVLAGSTARG